MVRGGRVGAADGSVAVHARICSNGEGSGATAGSVQGVVTWDDLMPLMCGIAYAAGVHADGQEERLDSGHRYLGMMLRGLHS